MGDAVDVRYEAANITAQIDDDLAILLMVTDKGRIAERTALLGLYAELGLALEQ